MDLQDFNNVILVIYLISLCSAAFALWVKWQQEEQFTKIDHLLEYHKNIEKQLAQIQKTLDKLTKKSPL